MKLIDIKDVCFKNQCICCPLYVEDESECILEHAPITWDLGEIERRLENYGKEEN